MVFCRSFILKGKPGTYPRLFSVHVIVTYNEIVYLFFKLKFVAGVSLIIRIMYGN
jgi:hypothetical protein